MTFKEWAERYYPNEPEEMLHKMSHAWAAGHINMACKEEKQSLKDHIKQLAVRINQWPMWKQDIMRPINKANRKTNDK